MRNFQRIPIGAVVTMAAVLVSLVACQAKVGAESEGGSSAADTPSVKALEAVEDNLGAPDSLPSDSMPPTAVSSESLTSVPDSMPDSLMGHEGTSSPDTT